MRAPVAAAAFLALGCLLAGAEVGLRAWQAHGLVHRLDAEGLRLFEAARQHQFLAALGLITCGLMLRSAASRFTSAGGLAFVAGILCFCGDVYAAAFRDGHATLGTAPFGGTLTILAWLLLAVGALRTRGSGAGTQI